MLYNMVKVDDTYEKNKISFNYFFNVYWNRDCLC